MKRSKFSEEQTAYVLRHVEVGTPAFPNFACASPVVVPSWIRLGRIGQITRRINWKTSALVVRSAPGPRSRGGSAGYTTIPGRDPCGHGAEDLNAAIPCVHDAVHGARSTDSGTRRSPWPTLPRGKVCFRAGP
jgi:hypothetical protein